MAKMKDIKIKCKGNIIEVRGKWPDGRETGAKYSKKTKKKWGSTALFKELDKAVKSKKCSRRSK